MDAPTILGGAATRPPPPPSLPGDGERCPDGRTTRRGSFETSHEAE